MAIKIKSAMVVAPMAMVMILAAGAGMANAKMQATEEVKIVSKSRNCLAALKGGGVVRADACDNANVQQKWNQLDWIDRTSSDGSHVYTFVNKGTGQALKSILDSSSVALTSNKIDVNSPYDASIAWTTSDTDEGLYAIHPAQDGKQNLIIGDNGILYFTNAWDDAAGEIWDFVSS